MYDPSKWLIRKHGMWFLYPPYQASPMYQFWDFENMITLINSEQFKQQVRDRDWRPAW
ncbi:hypothetical protein SEA_KEELAN_12 [Gordonia phage Keelan]|nr:hypothetical protein SEA_KEELAN_12 [Gordonia phage Keelan]